jgi:hypothetical protein
MSDSFDSMDEFLSVLGEVYEKFKFVIEAREKLQEMVNKNPIFYWLNQNELNKLDIFPQTSFPNPIELWEDERWHLE